VQLIIGFIILGGYPFPFLLLGGQFAWALVALWGLILFFWTLRKYTCSQEESGWQIGKKGKQ